MTELFTVGIPFFFILAIVYGALEVGGVFKNKGVKLLIALAIAAISITNVQIVEIINQYLPYAAIFFITFFFLGFIAKVFKGKKGENKDWFLIIVVVALVLILFARQGDTFRQFFDSTPISYENFVIILAALIMALVFYAAYKKGKQ